MKKITIEFVPEFFISKEILSIWPRRADSGPNRNNLFSVIQIRERYQKCWFRFQNDIGTCVLSFLTLLARKAKARCFLIRVFFLILVSQLPPSPPGGRTAGVAQDEEYDLPPPYSENPPLNPFYNEHSYDLTARDSPHLYDERTGLAPPGTRHSLNLRRSRDAPAGDAAATGRLLLPVSSGMDGSGGGGGGGGMFNPFTLSPLYPVCQEGPNFGQVIKELCLLARVRR